MFLEGFPSIRINHVQRKANQVAHSLARAGVGLLQDKTWFEEPSDLVVDLILEDSSVSV